MLPITYAIRNISRSWSKTLQVITGSTLTIFVIIAAAAFNQAMLSTLGASGEHNNVMLIGAGSEESIERSEIPATVPGIVSASIRGLQQQFGQTAVSGEIYYMGLVEGQSAKQSEALMRGVELPALQVHSQIAITQGRFPRAGELLVGRLAANQLEWPSEDLQVGAQISIDGESFTVSGVFEAPGSVFEAELWMNLSDMMAVSQRDALSCAVIKLDKAEFEDVDLFCKQRLDLELSAVRESDYYNKLSKFYMPIQVMVWITALLVVSGAVFGGLNTMYAAFISRKKELGTLQAVGYSRLSLIITMLQESFFLNLIATIIALSLTMVLLNGFQIAFASGVFALNIDNFSIILALISALLLSVGGIIVPAWHALYPPLTATLRS